MTLDISPTDKNRFGTISILLEIRSLGAVLEHISYQRCPASLMTRP
jgi:hypothetical protein